MAVTNLTILNPADKTRMFSVAVGDGAIALTDSLVTDTRNFPIGSQYTDKTNKKLYVRIAKAKAVADWAATELA